MFAERAFDQRRGQKRCVRRSRQVIACRENDHIEWLRRAPRKDDASGSQRLDLSVHEAEGAAPH